SQISETASLFTGLVLVNPSNADAFVNVTSVGDDGKTIAEDSTVVPANSKFLKLIRDIVPETIQSNGYIILRSSTPLYGVGLLGAFNNAFITSMPANPMPDGFAPAPFAVTPAIARVEPGTDVQTGTTLRVSLLNDVVDPRFFIDGRSLNARQLGPIGL